MRALRTQTQPLPAIVPMLLCLAVFGRGSAEAAVIFVTSLSQKVSATGGCSLQEAIYSANFDTNMIVTSTTFFSTGCVAGSGPDTIVLPTGAVFYMQQIADDIQSPFGPAATPMIGSSITIEGHGSRLEWIGSLHARAFAVASTGALTIRSVHVKNFRAKGGDGTSGGGGGMGAGGAIYVKGSGTLVVESCTFQSNGAIGGNGGAGVGPLSLQFGGGGGGLSGNGGYSIGSASAGGGGGGARGNGGAGQRTIGATTGGGGGGTLSVGQNGSNSGPGAGGVACGGNGGEFNHDGADAPCPGGGGGGGGTPSGNLGEHQEGNGGDGNYGGGGGGAGSGDFSGGRGGFGGGGGSADARGAFFGSHGGDGGFGGGGGAALAEVVFGSPGNGGSFGGNASEGGGGGGAALGGAIFNHGGTVLVKNSTFAGNYVARGVAGGPGAQNGRDAGAAIFAVDGSVTVLNSTINGNQTTGEGGGIVIYSGTDGGPVTFNLYDTIIAGNGVRECFYTGQVGNVTANGSGNLIVQNFGCPGMWQTTDPQLGPLQVPGFGRTPVMPISTTSPAFNTADQLTSLPTDQRGIDRPQAGGFDIGAYEKCVPPRPDVPFDCDTLVIKPPDVTVPLTVQVSPPAAGTTSPSPGIHDEPQNSVVLLTATANTGYCFMNWTGDVTDPASRNTTVLMDVAQVVSANFTTPQCGVDTSGSIAVTRGGYVLNPMTGRYAQTISLRNVSTTTIIGPISLVLDNLSANATLYNAMGVTSQLVPPAGSPYINASVNLGPGQTVSLSLQFTNPTRAAITYDTRVVAGPGSR